MGAAEDIDRAIGDIQSAFENMKQLVIDQEDQIARLTEENNELHSNINDLKDDICRGS